MPTNAEKAEFHALASKFKAQTRAGNAAGDRAYSRNIRRATKQEKRLRPLLRTYGKQQAKVRKKRLAGDSNTDGWGGVVDWLAGGAEEVGHVFRTVADLGPAALNEASQAIQSDNALGAAYRKTLQLNPALGPWVSMYAEEDDKGNLVTTNQRMKEDKASALGQMRKSRATMVGFLKSGANEETMTTATQIYLAARDHYNSMPDAQEGGLSLDRFATNVDTGTSVAQYREQQGLDFGTVGNIVHDITVSVALDLTTYAVPVKAAASGAKALAGTIKGAQNIKRLEQTLAAGGKGVDATIAARVARDGAPLVAKELAEEAAAKVLRHGSRALKRKGTTGAELIIGETRGAKLFGRYTIIPQEVTDVITTPVQALRALRRAGDTGKLAEKGIKIGALGDAFSGKLEGVLGPATRSGDTALANEAFETGRSARAAASSRAGRNSTLTLHAHKALRRIKGQELDDVVSAMHGSEAAGARLSERGQRAVESLRTVFNELEDIARQAGLELGHIENYFPLHRGEDLKAALKPGRPLSGNKAGFQVSRIRLGDTWMGQVVGDGLDDASKALAQAGDDTFRQSELERIAQEMFGDSYLNLFNKNPNQVVPAAIRAMTKRIERAETVQSLRGKGIIRDAQSLQPVKVNALTKKVNEALRKLSLNDAKVEKALKNQTKARTAVVEDARAAKEQKQAVAFLAAAQNHANKMRARLDNIPATASDDDVAKIAGDAALAEGELVGASAGVTIPHPDSEIGKLPKSASLEATEAAVRKQRKRLGEPMKGAKAEARKIYKENQAARLGKKDVEAARTAAAKDVPDVETFRADADAAWRAEKGIEPDAVLTWQQKGQVTKRMKKAHAEALDRTTKKAASTAGKMNRLIDKHGDRVTPMTAPDSGPGYGTPLADAPDRPIPATNDPSATPAQRRISQTNQRTVTASIGPGERPVDEARRSASSALTDTQQRQVVDRPFTYTDKAGNERTVSLSSVLDRDATTLVGRAGRGSDNTPMFTLPTDPDEFIAAVRAQGGSYQTVERDRLLEAAMDAAGLSDDEKLGILLLDLDSTVKSIGSSLEEIGGTVRVDGDLIYVNIADPGNLGPGTGTYQPGRDYPGFGPTEIQAQGKLEAEGFVRPGGRDPRGRFASNQTYLGRRTNPANLDTFDYAGTSGRSGTDTTSSGVMKGDESVEELVATRGREPRIEARSPADYDALFDYPGSGRRGGSELATNDTKADLLEGALIDLELKIERIERLTGAQLDYYPITRSTPTGGGGFRETFASIDYAPGRKISSTIEETERVGPTGPLANTDAIERQAAVVRRELDAFDEATEGARVKIADDNGPYKVRTGRFEARYDEKLPPELQAQRDEIAERVVAADRVVSDIKNANAEALKTGKPPTAKRVVQQPAVPKVRLSGANFVIDTSEWKAARRAHAQKIEEANTARSFVAGADGVSTPAFDDGIPDSVRAMNLPRDPNGYVSESARNADLDYTRVVDPAESGPDYAWLTDEELTAQWTRAQYDQAWENSGMRAEIAEEIGGSAEHAYLDDLYQSYPPEVRVEADTWSGEAGFSALGKDNADQLDRLGRALETDAGYGDRMQAALIEAGHVKDDGMVTVYRYGDAERHADSDYLNFSVMDGIGSDVGMKSTSYEVPVESIVGTTGGEQAEVIISKDTAFWGQNADKTTWPTARPADAVEAVDDVPFPYLEPPAEGTTRLYHGKGEGGGIKDTSTGANVTWLSDKPYPGMSDYRYVDVPTDQLKNMESNPRFGDIATDTSGKPIATDYQMPKSSRYNDQLKSVGEPPKGAPRELGAGQEPKALGSGSGAVFDDAAVPPRPRGEAEQGTLGFELPPKRRPETLIDRQTSDQVDIGQGEFMQDQADEYMRSLPPEAVSAQTSLDDLLDGVAKTRPELSGLIDQWNLAKNAHPELIEAAERFAVLADPMSVDGATARAAAEVQNASDAAEDALIRANGPDWRDAVTDSPWLGRFHGDETPIESPNSVAGQYADDGDGVAEALDANAADVAGADDAYLGRKYADHLRSDPDLADLYRAALEEPDPQLRASAALEAAAEEADRKLAALGEEGKPKLAAMEEASKKLGARASTSDVAGHYRDSMAAGMKKLLGDERYATSPMVQEALTLAGKTFEPGMIEKFLDHTVKHVVEFLKRWQTATPGFNVRNLAGDVYLNWLADVPLDAYPGYHRILKANKEYIALGGVEDGPLFAALSTVDKEIARQMRWMDQSGQHGRQFLSLGQAETALQKAQAINPLSSKGPLVRAPAALGRVINDSPTRGAMAYHVLRSGGSAEDAIDMVQKFHFNYADLSRSETNLKRIIPFYTWTRHNLPLQIEMMTRKPGKFMRWVHVKEGFENNVDVSGQDVAEYLDEGPLGGFPLPFVRGGGNTFVQNFLPSKDPQDFISDPKSSFSGMVTPFLKTPYEINRGIRTFKDIPISDREIDMPFVLRPMAPLMKQVGLAKEKNGKWTMSKGHADSIEQFYPLIGRLRRMIPNDPVMQARQESTLFSFFFGRAAVTNNEEQQQSTSDSQGISRYYETMAVLDKIPYKKRGERWYADKRQAKRAVRPIFERFEERTG